MTNRRMTVAACLLFAALSMAGQGCREQEQGAALAPERVLKLATTTSTDDSGLLKVLLPPFTAAYGIRVDVVAVGSGKAIKLAQNGDVDVVLVHDRDAEDAFVADGFGVNRRDVMRNDFVIVGPAADPAGIRGLADVVEAMGRIAKTGAAFVSRGDESGTHIKEKNLWRDAGVEPDGHWYLAAGQGMGAVLTIADEKQGYTLADRGTWIAFRKKLELEVLVEGDKRLANPYGVIPVNPARYPEAGYMEAMQFVAWLTSIEGQKLIAQFEVDGEKLFFPDAVHSD